MLGFLSTVATNGLNFNGFALFCSIRVRKIEKQVIGLKLISLDGMDRTSMAKSRAFIGPLY